LPFFPKIQCFFPTQLDIPPPPHALLLFNYFGAF
jgi:hypothetical protein